MQQPKSTRDGYSYQDLSKVPDVLLDQAPGKSLVLFCTSLGKVGTGYGGGGPIKEPLVNFLRSCGAGDSLDEVLDWKGWRESSYGSGYYCLLGQIGAGPNTGEEVQTLTQFSKILNWSTPIIPVWDGQRSLYTILDW